MSQSLTKTEIRWEFKKSPRAQKGAHLVLYARGGARKVDYNGCRTKSYNGLRNAADSGWSTVPASFFPHLYTLCAPAVAKVYSLGLGPYCLCFYFCKCYFPCAEHSYFTNHSDLGLNIQCLLFLGNIHLLIPILTYNLGYMPK